LQSYYPLKKETDVQATAVYCCDFVSAVGLRSINANSYQ